MVAQIAAEKVLRLIIGIGTDIVEIGRIQAAMQRDLFITRFFSPAERRYCESRGRQKAASYAARFAGKEAVVKALGTGFLSGRWQDIEILPDELGCPHVHLAGEYALVAQKKGVTRICISLSHSRDNAIAYVIMSND